MKTRYRKYNTVRTDTLESFIGLYEGKGETATAQAFRRLAKDLGAPIREDQIAEQKNRIAAEMRR
jgi:hypothetical protein